MYAIGLEIRNVCNWIGDSCVRDGWGVFWKCSFCVVVWMG